MADSENTGNSLNSIMGLKGYVGCQSEWMDNIAINVSNYEQFYKARCTENDSSYPSDYTAHIYDPDKENGAYRNDCELGKRALCCTFRTWSKM